MKLLSVGTNAKTSKSDAQGECLTAILYLAPANLAGPTVCPWATKGCKEACLNTSGRGAFNNVQQARINRTTFMRENFSMFLNQLIEEITAHVKRCEKLGVKPTIRLNGTSDILWEKTEIFDLFPTVQFYDYTKAPLRVRSVPNNYHLTYSVTEFWGDKDIKSVVNGGQNAAIVFQGKTLPTSYLGFEVINGDETDLRFKDKKGVIVGLLAKGKAKKDKSGFVRVVV